MKQLESKTQSRRHWLQLGWKSAAALVALGAPKLVAASSSSGRALVHLQLFGGNDSNNMLVPLDPFEYRRYAAARGALAIPYNSLLPIASTRLNARFGLHPNLTHLQDLYQRKVLAVVANTGSIHAPMTKLDVAAAGGVPTNPGDHFTADLMYVKDGFTTPGWSSPLLGTGDMIDLRETLFTFPKGVSMLTASSSLPASDSRANSPTLLRLMAAAPIRTVFPNTGLGSTLKQVAQLIYAAPNVGVNSPVILCSQPGYDTHGNELVAQAKLFAELSSALAAFDLAMVEIGAANQVTLFTETEFNRTLKANSTGGTDHAWGGHQLVLGHAVLGGDVYGKFPGMSLGGADDALTNGTWIPSTANEQYHATLANWFGVAPQRMGLAFPSLVRFAVKDLGFVA